jgi:hypothetical protein
VLTARDGAHSTRLRACAPARRQVAGALLTAFVIKFAGNVLKTFATVLALLCTCAVSTFLFDFRPTPLFGLGVAATAGSIWLYARPSLLASRAVAAEHAAAKDADVGEAARPLIGGLRR